MGLQLTLLTKQFMADLVSSLSHANAATCALSNIVVPLNIQTKTANILLLGCFFLKERVQFPEDKSYICVFPNAGPPILRCSVHFE